VRRGVEVTDLCVARGRVNSARTADGEEITAGHTVIAGGAWTRHTAARLMDVHARLRHVVILSMSISSMS
jgi:glycine/D-amino acid oxidase-like deaminating enzyme